MFLIWLAGQITARGIGNGIALILCRRDRASSCRDAIVATLELGRQGLLSAQSHRWASALLAVALIVLVVVQWRRRGGASRSHSAAGRRADVDGRAHLSFKLNGAGVIPALIASWVLALPLAPIALVRARRWPDSAVALQRTGAPLLPGLLRARDRVLRLPLHGVRARPGGGGRGRCSGYGGAIPQRRARARPPPTISTACCRASR